MSPDDTVQSVEQAQLARRWLHASQNLTAAYEGCLLPGWLVDLLSARIRRTIRPRIGALASGDALIALLDGEWKGATTTSLDKQNWVVTEAECALLGSPGHLSRYIRQVGNALDATRSIALLSQAYDCSDDKEVKALLSAEILRHSGDLIRVAAPAPQKLESFLPHSQRAVYEQLLAIGRAYFAPRPEGLKLRPRLAPLLVGPSGAGKTFLVTRVSQALGAKVLKVAYGDWMPRGCAAEYKPTIIEILRLVCRHDRVILIIDELDKWVADFSGNWSRSCSTDLWQILDRSPAESAVAEFLRANAVEDKPLKSSDVYSRLDRSMWVVGIGTWQDHHAPAKLGFNNSDGHTPADAVARIRRQKEIAPELLLRFSELIYVSYPTPDETVQLYESSGLTTLAQQLGIELHPRDHDWTQGGMRSLEQVAAKLLVAAQRQQTQQAITAAKTEVAHG